MSESGRLARDAADEGDRRDLAGPRLQHGFSRFAAARAPWRCRVIFGVGHFLPAVLIFVSAGAGAILRRALAQLSGNYSFSHSRCDSRCLIGALAAATI